jgi:hypothetical protein
MGAIDAYPVLEVMTMTMIRLALITLILLPSFALAEDVTLTCTPPTQNTDGSVLTDLAGIRYYESQVSGGPYTVVGDETVCSLVLVRSEGTYYYVSTAYNTGGVESVYSNEATKTVAPPVPAPPTGLTATGSLVAYGISQSEDVARAYPVGSVLADTACDPAMTFMGLYQVPKASVTFVGSVKPPVVFAECSGGLG